MHSINDKGALREAGDLESGKAITALDNFATRLGAGGIDARQWLFTSSRGVL